MFFEIINNKWINYILFIIIIFTTFLVLDYYLKNKMKYYNNLINKKNKNKLLANKYKKSYNELLNKYHFKIYKKEEVLQVINKYLLKRNLQLENIKSNEDKLLKLELHIEGKYKDVLTFFADVNNMENIVEIRFFRIYKSNKKNKTKAELKINFALKGFFENKNKINFPKKIHSANPFETKNMINNKKNHVNEKVKISLPFILQGIITYQKEKRAIIRNKNNTKIISKNYKNDIFEVLEIRNNCIKLKYNKTKMILNIGGNYGVIY